MPSTLRSPLQDNMAGNSQGQSEIVTAVERKFSIGCLRISDYRKAWEIVEIQVQTKMGVKNMIPWLSSLNMNDQTKHPLALQSITKRVIILYLSTNL
jgi:hypothetical protein